MAKWLVWEFAINNNYFSCDISSCRDSVSISLSFCRTNRQGKKFIKVTTFLMYTVYLFQVKLQVTEPVSGCVINARRIQFVLVTTVITTFSRASTIWKININMYFRYYSLKVLGNLFVICTVFPCFIYLFIFCFGMWPEINCKTLLWCSLLQIFNSTSLCTRLLWCW